MEYDRTPETLENEELSSILLNLLTPEQREICELKWAFTGDHHFNFWRDLDRHMGFRYGKSNMLWHNANEQLKINLADFEELLKSTLRILGEDDEIHQS